MMGGLLSLLNRCARPFRGALTRVVVLTLFLLFLFLTSVPSLDIDQYVSLPVDSTQLISSAAKAIDKNSVTRSKPWVRWIQQAEEAGLAGETLQTMPSSPSQPLEATSSTVIPETPSPQPASVETRPALLDTKPALYETKTPPKPASTSSPISLSESTDFSELVRKLRNTKPDALLSKALLSNFDGIGPAHLRDLGSRVRYFRQAFDIWEALHLIESAGSLMLQNPVARLRTLDLPWAQIRYAMEDYHEFGAFLHRVAMHLFPFTAKASLDHMSLRANLYNAGRGIVITASNEQVLYLLSSIPSIRRLGCDLPIEVMYAGDTDLSHASRLKLDALPGVVTRDLMELVDDSGWFIRGWAAKPFAMLMSSFREIISLDADALFFVNPAILFEDEQYVDTGALFFRDRDRFPELKHAWIQETFLPPVSANIAKNRIYTGQSRHMQESGVIVVDKWRHFFALLVTARLNGPDRDSNAETGKVGVYDMMYGDKETFWLGWELAGDDDYAFYEGRAGTMAYFSPEQREAAPLEIDAQSTLDSSDKEKSTTHPINPRRQKKPPISVCSPQLVHFDRDDKPLWFNGWVANHKRKEDGPIEYLPFTHYIYELEQPPLGAQEPWSPWRIEPVNQICLDSDEYGAFSTEELILLEDLMQMGTTEAQRDWLDRGG